MLSDWRDTTLPELLAQHGLAGLAERPFPNDGWSGATLTSIDRGRRRFVLKRTSWDVDWIARATGDRALREAVVATGRLRLPEPLADVYLGAAGDGAAGAAILTPDLSAELMAWERPEAAGAVPVETLDRVIDAIARLHRQPWGDAPPPDRALPVGNAPAWPWCPIPERLALLSRPSAEAYRSDGVAVGGRFLAGWDAFDRCAPAAARDLVSTLSADLSPLIAALARLPCVGLHGDLKLANVALLDERRIGLIDWQMVAFAPVAVELAWLLVSNVATLPEPPDAVLERYRRRGEAAAAAELHVPPPRETGAAWDGQLWYPPIDIDTVLGDWDAQVDLTWIIGLLLRGWRKGLDAEAGTPTGWGATSDEDLAWWCERAVDAADRRL